MNYEKMWKALKKTVKKMSVLVPSMENEFKLFENLMKDCENAAIEYDSEEEE